MVAMSHSDQAEDARRLQAHNYPMSLELAERILADSKGNINQAIEETNKFKKEAGCKLLFSVFDILNVDKHLRFQVYTVIKVAENHVTVAGARDAIYKDKELGLQHVALHLRDTVATMQHSLRPKLPYLTSDKILTKLEEAKDSIRATELVILANANLLAEKEVILKN